MAKASNKKPKLTPEEKMAELARLTGSVAAISHMGTSQPFVLNSPAPQTTPAPTPAAPTPAASAPEPAAVPVEATAPEPAAPPEPAVTVAPSAAAQPTPQPATPPVPAVSVTPIEPKGKKTPADAAPVPTPVATAAELPAEGAPDEEEVDEEEAQTVPTPAATGDGKDKLDLTSLFANSEEKKTFQVRITASHQQFFQQMGLLLGGGASSTDVIHNILAQFKEANEVQIQKAFQRQLRQMMSPKK